MESEQPQPQVQAEVPEEKPQVQEPKAREKGVAAVKAEFLLPYPAKKEEPEEEERPKKRVRGQNKHRQLFFSNDENPICATVDRGETCTFGESCRFSHDVEKYLSTKPKDLDGTCVNVTVHGSCPFTVSCRYRKSHPENMPLWEKKTFTPDETNIISHAMQKTLRSKKYPFLNVEPIIFQGPRPETGLTDALAQMQPEGEPEPEPAIEAPSSSATVPKVEDDGEAFTDVPIKTHRREKKTLDFRGKLYLAPLTTLGNLPFRRVCKEFGADITIGEMALAFSILQGNNSDLALLRRHESEDFFGVQLAGNSPHVMARAANFVSQETDVDFIDVNMGCPIDQLCNHGAGCALMNKPNRAFSIVASMKQVSDVPVTVKLRTGYENHHRNAHKLIPEFSRLGVGAITLHGRTKQQRYYSTADWNYIHQCAESSSVPMFGNGDVYSYQDFADKIQNSKLSGAMVSRGALIKPWVFTEIKEQRIWDISANERFDILKKFCDFGLQHWGSDTKGVGNTRRFLLEWQSFLHRYIPVGLLEVAHQLNEKPPLFFGRNDLETLMASPRSTDWIKLSEMLLGPVPEGFFFSPKHKANAIGSENDQDQG